MTVVVWDRERDPDRPPRIEIMRDPLREALRQLVRDGVLWGWGQPQIGVDGYQRWGISPVVGPHWFATSDELNHWLGQRA